MRLGLAVFVVGSLLGFVLVANQGHSVPGPDGGAGLPFVNWSLDRGDLRIAHFIGLHALQALPLLGFLLDRTAAAPAVRLTTVAGVAVAWLVVAGVTLVLALAGRPLIALCRRPGRCPVSAVHGPPRALRPRGLPHAKPLRHRNITAPTTMRGSLEPVHRTAARALVSRRLSV